MHKRLVLSLILVFFVQTSALQVECLKDNDCPKGGFCIGRLCSNNPFVRGCTSRIELNETCDNHDDENDKLCRMCNSHDNGRNDFCLESPLEYEEIRVDTGNWESSLFYAWIIQIILSEFLHVPVSLQGGNLNFYDHNISFEFNEEFENIKYNADALRNANNNHKNSLDEENPNRNENSSIKGDCVKSKETCAHVFPEIWPQLLFNETDDESNLFDEIEERNGNGMIGHLSWYIPKYLAEKDPSLATYLGYIGEEKREMLARRFKHPLTWARYCDEFSETNCTDDAARRYPQTDDEMNSYFDEGGDYNGYFKADNCGDKDKNCTGHFLDFPCDWPVNTVQQLVQNDIPLRSVSYTYSERKQILKAAYKAKEDIIYIGRYPDLHTVEYQPWRVQLPQATRKCIRNRVNKRDEESCPSNVLELNETLDGSCGYEEESLELGIASSLYNSSWGKTSSSTTKEEEARLSPSYLFLRRLRINSTEISDILQNYVDKRKKKQNILENYTMGEGYYAREAVCDWVKLNEEYIKNTFIPPTYPRKTKEIGNVSIFDIIAIVFGCFVIIVNILAQIATVIYKDAKVIVLAQRPFLNMLSLGYFLVCIGGILHALPQAILPCITKEWLIVNGYTQAYVPLMVKIHAISRLMHNAKKCKRVKISRKHLYIVVVASQIFIAVYMLIWTLVDAPKLKETFELDGHTVNIEFECVGGSYFRTFPYIWEAFHIASSAYLAFTTRNVNSEYNESRKLANMAYVRFVFFVVRLIVRQIPENTLAHRTKDLVISFCMSLDSLMAIMLYFGPKIIEARRHDATIHGRHESRNLFKDQSMMNSMRRLAVESFLGEDNVASVSSHMITSRSMRTSTRSGPANNTVQEIAMRARLRSSLTAHNATVDLSNPTKSLHGISELDALSENSEDSSKSKEGDLESTQERQEITSISKEPTLDERPAPAHREVSYAHTSTTTQTSGIGDVSSDSDESDANNSNNSNKQNIVEDS